jgi:hypothetical protein
MNDEKTEDPLRWESIVPYAEWEHQVLMRQALERLASAMARGDATIPVAQEQEIHF